MIDVHILHLFCRATHIAHFYRLVFMAWYMAWSSFFFFSLFFIVYCQSAEKLKISLILVRSIHCRRNSSGFLTPDIHEIPSRPPSPLGSNEFCLFLWAWVFVPPPFFGFILQIV